MSLSLFWPARCQGRLVISCAVGPLNPAVCKRRMRASQETFHIIPQKNVLMQDHQSWCTLLQLLSAYNTVQGNVFNANFFQWSQTRQVKLL